MNDNTLSQWLRLFHLPDLPCSLSSRLLRQFRTPDALFSATFEDLAQMGLGLTQIQALRRCADIRNSDSATTRALHWCEQSLHRIITLEDSAYPPLLREIPDAPPLLFVRGNPDALLLPQIAIVGSRRCSIDGYDIAGAFASDLSRRGLSVCSGLARGIDTAAHMGAVNAEGCTVAVLGTGADMIYPQSNRKLAEQIVQQGALISELPLGSSAKAGHFPMRNRIISGLSLGVIVIEAALQSGSLITARLAMEQNREVFAVPGSIRSPLSKGCHRLIREGVTLVESIEQVIEQIGSLFDFQLQAILPGRRSPCSATGDPATRDPELGSEERALLEVIGYDPVCLDTLVEKIGWTVTTVQSTLLNLEIAGKVRCESGRYRQS